MVTPEALRSPLTAIFYSTLPGVVKLFLEPDLRGTTLQISTTDLQ